jgi:predicted DNA-binding ribbon-helix-helix protein
VKLQRQLSAKDIGRNILLARLAWDKIYYPCSVEELLSAVFEERKKVFNLSSALKMKYF